MTSLDFELSTDKAARIAFTMEPSTTNIPYEIVIGGNGNTVTKIYRLDVLMLKKTMSSDNVLSGPPVYDRFWLNFASGNFSLGRYGNAEPFFNWSDPDPLEFTSIGIMTWSGSTGRWKFHSFC
ncbi:uncharacterized protein [Diadema antillarum]|uniref:uncharacterized protein n=1 Tax=Diadema antillarum TaxID=105358 RepID=UPI003A87A006